MKYRYLTGTGLQVSQLALGTMMFGGQTNEADSIEIIRCAIDGGINFIDTADLYNHGVSEEIVGKGMGADRARMVLATKVFNPTSGDVNDRGLSRRHIINACNASLKRLGTDYIDLYYMHNPDYHTPIEESMEAMSTLVRDGKVRYIGVSNMASWQVCDLLWLSDKRNYIAPTVSQNVYNLITRGIDRELLPFAKAHDIGVVVYNPIAAGLLAGKHKYGQIQAGTRFANNPMYADRYLKIENFEALDMLTDLAREHGMSILELAMKWTVSRVDVAITGVSRLEQLQQNMASVEGEPLSQEVLDRCDEIWKGLAGVDFKYNR